MKKKIIKLFMVMLVLFVIPVSVFAHSGRTDSSGGHHDNKNKSGLGSYHYHHGYPAHLHPGGVCPYDTPVKPKPTPKPSISITGKPKILTVGESAGLEYTINNTTDFVSEVTSDNEEVIIVNEDQTLTAVGAGTAKITVSNSEVAKTFTVTVKAVPVTSMEISVPETIQLGKTAAVKVKIYPENATDQSVTWKAADPDILLISNQTIKAKGVGTTELECTSANGITETAEITVYEVFPEEIRTDVEEISLLYGETNNISAAVFPEDANNKNVIFTVSNPEIAEINGNQIRALQDGETELVITTENGISKTIPVTVFHNPVESILIDDSEMNYIFTSSYEHAVDINGKIVLNAMVQPQDATWPEITWKSSDSSIVEVNGDTFTIKGTGDVVLRAVCVDGAEGSMMITIVDSGKIIMRTVKKVFAALAGIGGVMAAGMIIVIKRRKTLKKKTDNTTDNKKDNKTDNQRQKIIKQRRGQKWNYNRQ